MNIPSAEITVALIGNVSAGKTTLLNALLQAKFGEVSMKRTTTRANYFRIHVIDTTSVSNDKSTIDQGCQIPPAKRLRSSDSVFNEIVHDNQVKIREGDKVLENVFDIELNEALVDCRKNTTLVIVDIPGINEAHTDEEYKEYVSNKWNTFDCVVVVMDGKQGVNTQEQIFLLDFVKQNLQEKKYVPVIVLCNKIDDSNDEDQAELVREAQKEVEKIFHPILDASDIAFIPFSSMHAYIHQCASTLTMDQFKKFDSDLIEKLGRDQVGRRRWNKMTNEEKLKEAYSLVSDPDSVKEALRDSNFDTFLCTLRNFVGGESKQLELIEKQLEVAKNEMLAKPYKQGNIISNYRILYERTKHLVSPDKVEFNLKNLKTTFWTAYRNYEDHCLSVFADSNFCDVHVLAGPMEELIESVTFNKKNADYDELQQVQIIAKKLIQKKIELLVSKKNEEKNRDNVAYFSPMDWYTIWSGILLMSYHRHFCIHLGKEKLLIERLASFDNWKCLVLSDVKLTHCPNCHTTDDSFSNNELHDHSNGTDFVPNGKYCIACQSFFPSSCFLFCFNCNKSLNKGTLTCMSCDYRTYLPAEFNHYIAGAAQDMVAGNSFSPKIILPDSINDPKHYGHLLFKFCYLMDCCDEINSSILYFH